MSREYNAYVYDPDLDVEIEISVDWSISGEYVPARLSGPPEDCYPAEYPELEVLECTVHEFGRVYHVDWDEVIALNPDEPEELEQYALAYEQDRRDAALEDMAEEAYYARRGY